MPDSPFVPADRLRNAAALFLGAAMLVLGGCASDPEPVQPEIRVNPDVVQASLDLEEARALGGLWLVRDPAFNDNLVSLDEMLGRARTLHEDKRADAASSLARRISRYARLGIIQAKAESNALPYYPQ